MRIVNGKGRECLRYAPLSLYTSQVMLRPGSTTPLPFQGLSNKPGDPSLDESDDPDDDSDDECGLGRSLSDLLDAFEALKLPDMDTDDIGVIHNDFKPVPGADIMCILENHPDEYV